MPQLLGISLWEPWASAMRAGLKSIETRSWKAPHRGELVICSSRRRMTKEDEETFEIFVRPTLEEKKQDLKIYYGCAIAVVSLDDCIPTQDIRDSLPGIEVALGDFSIDRWAWKTSNLRPLPTPIPVIGRQGLFPIPQDAATLILNQINQPITAAA